jgi:FkbM family methyltransferase
MIKDRLKQIILGTPLGKLLIDLNFYIEILSCLFSTDIQDIEDLKAIVNDTISLNLVTQLCGRNKIFLDVGAHIGSVIFKVLNYDPQIKVIAVEAIPKKAQDLRLTFPSAQVYAYAVGESNEEVSFYINPKKSAYSSLMRPLNNQDFVEIKVPMKRIDDFVDGEIDVIKIDVEGAELGVLKGGKQVISKNRPIIMFESSRTKKDDFNYSKHDLWKFFNDLGYLLFIPNRLAHYGPALTLDGFIESHYYPRRTTNYFAIPTERHEEIKNLARKILRIS